MNLRSQTYLLSLVALLVFSGAIARAQEVEIQVEPSPVEPSQVEVVEEVATEDAVENVQKEQTDLQQALIGAWSMIDKPDTEKDPEFGGRIKFFGLGDWCITQCDPETGVMIVHHGGTYTLDGDNYLEKITYAGESTKSLIGKELKFKITIEGDIYNQVGDGNPYTETWRRMK